jgi:adenylyltransferase/sulfurtransferase
VTENHTALNFSDDELLRYSRQIMLPAFDIAGQLALKNAAVLVIGLGGLGSPASMYLAAAGVGRLGLLDFDEVDLSNLQRQIVHGSDTLGQPKVSSAMRRLQQLNASVEYDAIHEKLDEKALAALIANYDMVLDCSDNFETRFAVNRVCVAGKVPLVSGAAIRMEGQISVFDARDEDSPCYQCLYPESGNEDLNCSQSGVMAPLVGVIGAMQALEAIKLLAGIGERSVGKLLIFDAMNMEWRRLKLGKDPSCRCCAGA